ncbi:MAG: C4-dicarboxylate ABC transporter substrate-binding protein, partial [Pseudomonadota bacterium]
SYMGAMWWMNNDNFLAMPEDLRRVVVDGFSALQQATFASPKRKSIEAYEAFVAGGGDIYVPSPEEKAAFAAAAEPVNAWFRENVDGGGEMLDALQAAVAEVEAELAEAYASDLQ